MNFRLHLLCSSCVSGPHGGSLTDCCIFRCSVPSWNERRRDECWTQLPQHWARGCLYCCYHGDMPLNSQLCNKDLKFILVRMKEQSINPLWGVHTTSAKVTKWPSVASYIVAESPLKCYSSAHWCGYVPYEFMIICNSKLNTLPHLAIVCLKMYVT